MSKIDRYTIKKEEGNSCDFYYITDPLKECPKCNGIGMVDGEKCKCFGTGKRTWQVTHNMTKDLWTCECRYWSIKGLECSHIERAKRG